MDSIPVHQGQVLLYILYVYIHIFCLFTYSNYYRYVKSSEIILSYTSRQVEGRISRTERETYDEWWMNNIQKLTDQKKKFVMGGTYIKDGWPGKVFERQDKLLG